jgi:hypothetical protein
MFYKDFRSDLNSTTPKDAQPFSGDVQLEV